MQKKGDGYVQGAMYRELCTGGYDQLGLRLRLGLGLELGMAVRRGLWLGLGVCP